MIRIGITGQAGFIGTHLAEYVGKCGDFALVPFEDAYFADPLKLRAFVKKCDVLVHLAAASRMPSEAEPVCAQCWVGATGDRGNGGGGVTPRVMFATSTHETRDTAYGRAKLEGRRLFEDWAKEHNADFVGFVFPNIFGPGARVHYASFIANFAWELQHGGKPEIKVDALMRLKYVGSLIEFMMGFIDSKGVARIEVPHDFELKVSDVLTLFKMFQALPAKAQWQLVIPTLIIYIALLPDMRER